VIRQKICEAAEWLGAAVDNDLNQNNEESVSSPQSRIDVLVIPTDEEAAVAKEILNV
jgi:acetate kinase